MRYTLALREEHATELRRLVLPAGGAEGVAYVLLGRSVCSADPWTGEPECRFLSREVIPLAQEDLLSSSPQHINARTRTLARVLQRARERQCTVGVVHGHPGELCSFSAQDDLDEPALLEIAQHRNGPDEQIVSAVIVPSGTVFGRVWTGRAEKHELRLVGEVGTKWQFWYAGRGEGATNDVLARQTLAFGPVLNQDLSMVRVGIVGCGGTGSALGLLLARLGVKRIMAFDDDVAETTNLNRLHGATTEDVRSKVAKVEVLRRSLETLGMGIDVRTFRGWVGDEACRDQLRACDVIFGCTDDHDGRLLLNRFAYFYLTPVIDMGIGIDVDEGQPPRITEAAARVTVVGPGSRCLVCRGVVDPRLAAEDALERSDPAEYGRRLKERYVRGGGRPDPAVVTFTTEVACMAVDELLHRLSGYRAGTGSDHRVRKYLLGEDKRPGCVPHAECPACGRTESWGRGDMIPFLDRVG